MRQCKITDPFIAYLRVCRWQNPPRPGSNVASVTLGLWPYATAMAVVGPAVLRLG
jgi:hypothetical protein